MEKVQTLGEVTSMADALGPDGGGRGIADEPTLSDMADEDAEVPEDQATAAAMARIRRVQALRAKGKALGLRHPIDAAVVILERLDALQTSIDEAVVLLRTLDAKVDAPKGDTKK